MTIVLVIIVAPIIVGVVVGLIVKYDTRLVRWCASALRRIRTWPARRRKSRAKHKRKQLMSQMIERSKVLGVRVWISVQPGSPSIATDSLGGQLAFFNDLQAFQAACKAGRADPRRDSPWGPPKTIVQMTDEEIQQWLDDHPVAE